MLFLQEAVGGAAFGLACGWVTYLLLKSVEDYKVEVLLTLALATGGYALAEQLHVSAPIFMVTAGLIVGNHGRQFGMSETNRVRLDVFWELIDEALNAILFILIGLEVVVIRIEASQIALGLFAILAVLAGRLLSVGLPVGLMGLGGRYRQGTISLLTWGGLRGGLSIAMALSLVIALFYTAELVWMNLFLAGMGAAILAVKSRLNVQAIWFYAVVGVFMWLCVLKSGVHATVAGVMIGLLLPLEGKQGKPAPADVVEHALQPWVRWLVLPLFAFFNVGVDLGGLTWEKAFSSLTLAVALGLFVGKQLGVFGMVWILEKGLGFARPQGASWRQVHGVACLCGIGFTMSLFIGSLALPEEEQYAVRLGVLGGSALSAALAVFVLRRGAPTSAWATAVSRAL